MLITILATLVSAAPAQPTPKPAEPPSSIAAPSASVVIKVLLPDGSPAAGVEVGISIHRADEPAAGLPLEGLSHEGRKLEVTPADGKPNTTDASGVLSLERKWLYFDETQTRPRPICALSKDRSLIGLGKPDSAGEELVISLVPACRVTAKIRSSEAISLGRVVRWTNLHVWWGSLRPVGIERVADGVHEFILPPGEFRLFASGTDTADESVPITIASGDTRRDIDIDLPASRIARLIGKPAPELKSIKGWKNGGPVKFSELKGKVILLDFWGQWCGPCIGAMPELMELHDKYKDQGLVIIAVHDDSTDSIESMDELLKSRREKLWAGRDLPFLVALDGGGETRIPGGKDTARGASTAEYGIQLFPSQVLIDRNGNVVGLRRPAPNDQLADLIATK